MAIFSKSAGTTIQEWAALITLFSAALGAIVWAYSWTSNTSARIKDLEAQVEKAQLRMIPEETDRALEEIQGVVARSITTIESKSGQMANLEQEVSEKHAINLERFREIEEELRKAQKSALGTFQTQMRNEMQDADVRMSNQISQKTASFSKSLAAIPETLTKVETIAKATETMVTEFKAEVSGLENKASGFSDLLTAYQSSVESRFNDVDQLPAGALILVSGRSDCPQGYRKFARTLFFAFKDDLSLVRERDFLQDSAYDIGRLSAPGESIVGSISNSHTLEALSYDGQLVQVCRAQ
jgi:hypothetical protein